MNVCMCSRVNHTYFKYYCKVKNYTKQKCKKTVPIVCVYYQGQHTSPWTSDRPVCNSYSFSRLKRLTMCPPSYHHNGFMATPELGHRMYCYLFGGRKSLWSHQSAQSASSSAIYNFSNLKNKDDKLPNLIRRRFYVFKMGVWLLSCHSSVCSMAPLCNIFPLQAGYDVIHYGIMAG